MERFVAVSYQLFSLMVAVILTAEHVRAIDTVPQLNVSQYIGMWYQVYGDYVDGIVARERNCICATANYGLNPNGTISVRNACRQKTPDGKLEVVKGYAFRPNEKEPGQLKVVFPGILNVGGYYWVVQLGPATYQGNQYQYSIVSDPLKLSLFVLARDVTEFKQKYDAEVLKKVTELGFTSFYDKPTDIYQGNDCVYV